MAHYSFDFSDRKKEGGKELAELAMRQSNGIIETSVDFAIFSKEQMGNLCNFITICWKCLDHLSDVDEFTLELLE